MSEQSNPPRPGIIPGRAFVEWLRNAGIVGDRVYRVAIEASVRDVVKIYVEQYGTELLTQSPPPPEFFAAPLYEFGAAGIPIFPSPIAGPDGAAPCLVCNAPGATVITDTIEVTKPGASHKQWEPLTSSAFCAAHMREPITIDIDGRVMTATQWRGMVEAFGEPVR